MQYLSGNYQLKRMQASTLKKGILLIVCGSMISACGSLKLSDSSRTLFEWEPDKKNLQVKIPIEVSSHLISSEALPSPSSPKKRSTNSVEDLSEHRDSLSDDYAVNLKDKKTEFKGSDGVNINNKKPEKSAVLSRVTFKDVTADGEGIQLSNIITTLRTNDDVERTLGNEEELIVKVVEEDLSVVKEGLEIRENFSIVSNNVLMEVKNAGEGELNLEVSKGNDLTESNGFDFSDIKTFFDWGDNTEIGIVNEDERLKNTAYEDIVLNTIESVNQFTTANPSAAGMPMSALQVESVQKTFSTISKVAPVLTGPIKFQSKEYQSKTAESVRWKIGNDWDKAHRGGCHLSTPTLQLDEYDYTTQLWLNVVDDKLIVNTTTNINIDLPNVGIKAGNGTLEHFSQSLFAGNVIWSGNLNKTINSSSELSIFIGGDELGGRTQQAVIELKGLKNIYPAYQACNKKVELQLSQTY